MSKRATPFIKFIRLNETRMKRAAEAYMNGLRRYMVLSGMATVGITGRPNKQEARR